MATLHSLILMILVFLCISGTAAPAAASTDLSSTDPIPPIGTPFQDSPPGASTNALDKRHEWVLTCYGKGPDGREGWESPTLSRRCIARPFHYYCDGITAEVKKIGNRDTECSTKCRCEKKLTNYLPICQLLLSPKMGTKLC